MMLFKHFLQNALTSRLANLLYRICICYFCGSLQTHCCRRRGTKCDSSVPVGPKSPSSLQFLPLLSSGAKLNAERADLNVLRQVTHGRVNTCFTGIPRPEDWMKGSVRSNEMQFRATGRCPVHAKHSTEDISEQVILGPISLKQVKEVLPFRYQVMGCTLKLTCHLVEIGGNEKHGPWRIHYNSNLT